MNIWGGCKGRWEQTRHPHPPEAQRTATAGRNLSLMVTAAPGAPPKTLWGADPALGAGQIVPGGVSHPCPMAGGGLREVAVWHGEGVERRITGVVPQQLLLQEGDSVQREHQRLVLQHTVHVETYGSTRGGSLSLFGGVCDRLGGPRKQPRSPPELSPNAGMRLMVFKSVTAAPMFSGISLLEGNG